VTGEPTRRSLEAVVFDFDGVLADTEPLHLRVFQQTLARHGVALDDALYYERYLGYDDAGVFRTLAEDRHLAWTAADTARLVEEKARSFRVVAATHPTLFAGVAERLRGWAGQVPMAIASGALRDEIVIILDAADLVPVFPVIVAAGETPRGKPAPDPFAEAVRQLGAAPRRSVAVEDSVWGIESARAAGLKVVAVATSYPRDRLTTADAVVDSFTDLTLELFQELAAR
jgi:beta-phosphoglucomutase